MMCTRRQRLLPLALLPLLLLSFFAFGSVESSRPSSFVDEQGAATDEELAYDGANGTAALLLPSGNANLTYASFTNPGKEVTVDVKRLDLLVDLLVANMSDDRWAVDYSNDSGATWQVLRALGGANQSRGLLRFPDLAGPGGDWNWSSIATSLSLRFRYDVVGGADSVNFSIYEIWANVTSDEEGPRILLLGPPDQSNYTGLTQVNFSYNASDALSALQNCSLLINGGINRTNATPPQEGVNNFSLSLDNGRYNWSVECWDDAVAANSNASQQRALTVDNAGPNITLLSPGQGEELEGSQIVTFTYAFTDLSRLENCSLYLNGSRNQTTTGDEANWPSGRGQFLLSLPNGEWAWNVTCTDIHGFQSWSATARFNQSANDAPTISGLSVPARVSPQLGSNSSLSCNATITDLQGQLTIDTVTAYLHRSDWSYDDPDETSGHHTSTDCTSVGVNSTSLDYSCSFSLPPYARSMNWTCTYRATDDLGYEAIESSTLFVEPLYAFDLSPAYISYGAIEAGQISGERPITVRNIGNAEIDMTLDGYAVSDGDGLAMVCDLGNTSLEAERYAVESGQSFEAMTSLTDEPVQVEPFNLAPQNDSYDGEEELYWRIRLGVPQDGDCSGFVTFTAVIS